jgi:hypothetical protein
MVWNNILEVTLEFDLVISKNGGLVELFIEANNREVEIFDVYRYVSL